MADSHSSFVSGGAKILNSSFKLKVKFHVLLLSVGGTPLPSQRSKIAAHEGGSSVIFSKLFAAGSESLPAWGITKKRLGATTGAKYNSAINLRQSLIPGG